MAEKDSKLYSELRPTSSVNIDRRRFIAGMGTLAVASWLPSGVTAQNAEHEAEILIIGGGMAGAATAFHLAQQGRNVMLLERGKIASEASGQNMGGLGGAGWGNMPDLQSYLTMGSLDIFKQLQIDMGYDMEFRRSGALTGIHTEEQYDFLQDRVQSLRSNGYDGELLTPREARTIEPEVNRDLLGYMYFPKRGQADPVKSTQAFAHAAKVAGASINTGQNVTAISVQSNGGYLIQTDRTEYICQTLVLATGAWCGPVGQMLGLKIPVIPVRGQMWATEGQPPRIFHDISSAESSYNWSQDNGA